MELANLVKAFFNEKEELKSIALDYHKTLLRPERFTEKERFEIQENWEFSKVHLQLLELAIKKELAKIQ